MNGPTDWVGRVDAETARELLLGTIDAVAAAPALAELAGRVADLVTRSLRVDVCFVHVLDDDERGVTLMGATPPYDAQAGKVHLALDEGVSGWVAARRQPVVIVEGKLDDPRYRYFPELGGLEFVSMASVPMVSRPTGLAGVLNVHTRTRRAFDDGDIALLTGIGQLVAGAVHAARLHRQLLVRRQEYEALVEQALAVQEQERRRIAAEVHDGVAQAVVSLSFHLAAAAEALEEEPRFAAEQVATARRLAELAVAEARAAVEGLRPPMLDDLGLPEALQSLASTSVGEGAEVTCDVAVDADALPDHVQVAVYRMAQEAMQNVAKHAGATQVLLEVRGGDDELTLRVRDDGAGIEPPPGPGFGPASIRQRAELLGGTLTVTSHPGRGTELLVRLPLPD